MPQRGGDFRKESDTAKGHRTWPAIHSGNRKIDKSALVANRMLENIVASAVLVSQVRAGFNVHFFRCQDDGPEATSLSST